MSNMVVKENAASDKVIDFRNTMLSLVQFDMAKFDEARIIYFSKKGCNNPYTWISVIDDGLGLIHTHPETRFNVNVTIANYSDELQKYEISNHNMQNMKGREIVSYCFNCFQKDIDCSDLVRIDACTASTWGKPYSISCVFARNDLESGNFPV